MRLLCGDHSNHELCDGHAWWSALSPLQMLSNCRLTPPACQACRRGTGQAIMRMHDSHISERMCTGSLTHTAGNELCSVPEMVEACELMVLPSQLRRA